MLPTCEEINELGKGISCASRYGLLEALMDGSKTVTQLVAAVTLSQPAVSQHLAMLKAYKLVTKKKIGQEVYYSLDTRHMLAVIKRLSAGVERCRSSQKPSRSRKLVTH